MAEAAVKVDTKAFGRVITGTDQSVPYFDVSIMDNEEVYTANEWADYTADESIVWFCLAENAVLNGIRRMKVIVLVRFQVAFTDCNEAKALTCSHIWRRPPWRLSCQKYCWLYLMLSFWYKHGSSGGGFAYQSTRSFSTSCWQKAFSRESPWLHIWNHSSTVINRASHDKTAQVGRLMTACYDYATDNAIFAQVILRDEEGDLVTMLPPIIETKEITINYFVLGEKHFPLNRLILDPLVVNQNDNIKDGSAVVLEEASNHLNELLLEDEFHKPVNSSLSMFCLSFLASLLAKS